MVDESQIKQWLKDGTITRPQAKKMLADTTQYRKESTSNKLIVSISTIGAILIGIGAILFIASNWRAIPNVMKVLILLAATFISYFLGYLFAYEKKNLPKVGNVLLFLGALLFGASVFLVAQIYNITANHNSLVLIWLIGILPLVYALKSVSIAGLASLLYFIWGYLLIFQNNIFSTILLLPIILLVAGVLLFGIGALHYISDSLATIARTYRIAGIKAVMISLFLLTFRFFSGPEIRRQLSMVTDPTISNFTRVSPHFTAIFVTLSIIAILITVINLLFNTSKSDTNVLENTINLTLLATILIFFFYPPTTNLYIVLFNLIISGIIFVLLYVGYQRSDMKLINIGMGFFSLLVIVRYFDFFWNLLDRSLFFLIGGIILVLGGISLELKRRQLRDRFTS